MQPLSQSLDSATAGSLDRHGAGDHDQSYRFGRRPCASAPYPFSTRQYARLLIMRSRHQAGVFGSDDPRADLHPTVSSKVGTCGRRLADPAMSAVIRFRAICCYRATRC
jgi:hypothetical protein